MAVIQIYLCNMGISASSSHKPRRKSHKEGGEILFCELSYNETIALQMSYRFHDFIEQAQNWCRPTV